MVDDYDAITRTCQLYIEGGAQGDPQQLKRAFHPVARVFGDAGGQRLDVPVDQFIEIACASPVGVGGKYRGRVQAIQQTGDVAVATIVEDGCWGQVSFVDYLSLVRIGGEWKIVTKIFALTGGQMPRS
jgi:hypothetical protein